MRVIYRKEASLSIREFLPHFVLFVFLIGISTISVSAGASIVQPLLQLERNINVESRLDLTDENPKEISLSSGQVFYRFQTGLLALESQYFEDALLVFQELARAGHISSQYYLALMYDEGVGIDRDRQTAAYWYRLAAGQGHMDAQFNLGSSYAHGEGVSTDIRKAIFWWKKAAQQGSVDSQFNLGMAYVMGHGIPANIQKAVYWWRRAAKNGDASAQYHLGLIYSQENAVGQDMCEASRWLQVSAEQGHEGARYILDNLQRSGTDHVCLSKKNQ